MSSDLRYRLGGVLLLIVAGAAAWLGIVQPLESAEAGAAVLRWMPKITVLISVSAVFGLFFIFTGNRRPYRDVEKQTLTTAGWVLFAIIAVVALGAYFWMDFKLRGMGYHH